MFSAEGHVFTTQKKEYLIGNGIDFLYVKEDSYEKIKQYRSKNLVSLLKNPELTSDERAELIHASIHDQTYDMFHSEVTNKKISAAKENIILLVDEMISERLYSESLLRLVAHDYNTYSHCVNVSIYALALAKEIGLDKDEMIKLGSGALLHDLGKSKIPAAIINKPGKLTLAEFQEIKQHPDIGYRMLKEIGETDSTILDIVKHHHEKLDGSGYGIGLKGERIKLEIQIVSVADIFDALTTNRSYKTAETYFTSFKTMKIAMKEQINLELVDKLIKLMGRV